MYALIIIIHVVVCLILIAAILLQSGRGGGLAEMLGGATSQTIFGTRASTFLTRATTVAASLFLVTCISLTIFSSRSGRSLLEGQTTLVEEAAELEKEPVAQVTFEKGAAQTVEEAIQQAVEQPVTDITNEQSSESEAGPVVPEE
ncbi:preprotein translocase subunit SecG [Candidatus Omnitrophota bacterium]